MAPGGSQSQLAGSGSQSGAPLRGCWELQDCGASRPTRPQQIQQPAAGRPLLVPPRGRCRQPVPLLCALQAQPRFASMTAAALTPRGSKCSVDGLQAVPAGVMEGAPTELGCVLASSRVCRAKQFQCLLFKQYMATMEQQNCPGMSVTCALLVPSATWDRQRHSLSLKLCAGTHQKQYAWDARQGRLRALEPEDWEEGEEAARTLRGRLRRAAHDLRSAFFPHPDEVSPGARGRGPAASVAGLACGRACSSACLACQLSAASSAADPTPGPV